MIKSLVAFSWLDKLFPTQASYTELTTSQQQRLKIIWSSVAILLALLVFLALLFVLNTPTPATTPIKNVVQTATYQSTTPGQTLEFKAPTPLNAQLDPNFTVVSGKVESDANYITFSMQIAGQLVTNGSINQVYQVGIDTDLDGNTGYLMPQVGIGAEYIADLDAKGNAVLLHWLSAEHVFQPIVGMTEQQIGTNQIIFIVPRAALGFPTAVNLTFLAADQGKTQTSFLPETGFVHYQLPLQGLASASTATPIWPFSLNYGHNAGVNSVELTQAVDSKLNPDFDITDAKLSSDGITLTVTIQVAGKIVADSSSKAGQQLYQVFLDTDNDSTDNLVDTRLGLGSEYIADYDANGFNSILGWQADSDSFIGVAGLHTDISNNKLTYTIPLQSLANPTTIRFSLAGIDNRANQHNYLPDHSAASLDTGLAEAAGAGVVLTNNSSALTTADSADANLVVNKANFIVKDGVLVATLKTAAPLSSSNLPTASYQVWLGKTITETETLTNTFTTNASNLLVPNLQVYYKIIFTPASQTAALFSWSDRTQAFEYTQAIAYTAQQDSIELQIPLATIGTGAVGCYIETFNSSDGFGFSLPPTTPQPLFLAGSAKYVLQANPTLSNLSIPLTNTLVTDVTLQRNIADVSFAVNFAQPVQTNSNLANYSKLQFWLDSDADPQTGAATLQAGLGVDYLIKYDQRLDSQQAQLYKYDTSTQSMLLLAQLPLHFSADHKHVDFIVPLSKVNLNRFFIAVHADAPIFNQSQVLPRIARGFAIVDFQYAQSSQLLEAPVGPNSSSSGEAYTDLKQFELGYDNFFVKGRFTLAGLPTSGVKAVYTVNLAAFTTDPHTTSSFEDSITYYVLSYDTVLDRGVLERWDGSKASYEFVSQIDRTLDTQHNILELRVPYSLLAYPNYSYYNASITTATGTVSLPVVGSDSQQQIAAFAFKNPISNLREVMKQN
jgi:hypothetical protein